ncbi:hypothetical protein AAHH80_33110, partial [Burkholderia pseudomallei]
RLLRVRGADILDAARGRQREVDARRVLTRQDYPDVLLQLQVARIRSDRESVAEPDEFVV